MTKPETRKNTLQRINEAEERIEDLSNVVKFLTDELARVEKDHAGAIGIITDQLKKVQDLMELPWWKRVFARFE